MTCCLLAGSVQFLSARVDYTQRSESAKFAQTTSRHMKASRVPPGNLSLRSEGVIGDRTARFIGIQRPTLCAPLENGPSRERSALPRCLQQPGAASPIRNDLQVDNTAASSLGKPEVRPPAVAAAAAAAGHAATYATRAVAACSHLEGVVPALKRAFGRSHGG